MKKNCEYCGDEFSGLRSTRKYCSENCKQLSYYKRNAGSLEGNDRVKLPFTVKDNVKQIPLTDDVIEQLADRILIVLEEKIEQMIELNVKQRLALNGKTGLNVKPFDYNNSDVTDIEEQDVNSDLKILELPEDHETEEQTGLTNDPNLSGTENVYIVNNKEVVKEYKRIESNFLNRIGAYLDHSKEVLKFLPPYPYSSRDELMRVKWVSLRFRCLMETLIKLSNYSYIDKEALFSLAEAFNKLISSEQYRLLPTIYPYTAFIHELQQKTSCLAKEHKNSDRVRFRISPAKRAELIAKRHEMGNFVQKIKFSQLEF